MNIFEKIKENERLKAENESLKKQNSELVKNKENMEKQWQNWWQYNGECQVEEKFE
ncbi:MAG: hypothetical protein RR052_01575 [Oscillospiraceae bacterium]